MWNNTLKYDSLYKILQLDYDEAIKENNLEDAMKFRSMLENLEKGEREKNNYNGVRMHLNKNLDKYLSQHPEYFRKKEKFAKPKPKRKICSCKKK